jgi:hypothetical protein
MSEKQEKRKRFERRMEYVSEFNAWLMKEPPMWKFRAWLHWKKTRPAMEDLARYLEGKR